MPKYVCVTVSVNEYLRLSSSISPMDRAQAQRVKAAFERRNQKSTAVVAQLQRKLESYKQRLHEVESSRRLSSGSGGMTLAAGSPWPAFDLLKGIRSVLNLLVRLIVTENCHFSSAVHISWSKCCLCLWMLTRVAQILTIAHRDL